MKKILVIKLTSLGDLIHTLPALSDAMAAIPEIAFDWMIDENFQEVATWHPAVKNIFTTNHRVWRKGLLHPSTLRSISHLTGSVRKNSYDLVIDAQGNFKTALLSLFTHGQRAGFDRHSVREWIAHLAYQKKCAASKNSHAIDRLRRLFASALDYPLPLTPPNFGIDREKFRAPGIPLPADYTVFIHIASWKTKLWPEEHWKALIRKTISDGLSVLLPWGNQEEKLRAERLAIDPRVHVLPKLSLSEIGHIIQHARACVSLDTGLSHLAAALEVPAVTLYGATNAGLIGTPGEKQVHLTSSILCAPCGKKQCRFSSDENPCLQEISPDRVYTELLRQASLRYL